MNPLLLFLIIFFIFTIILFLVAAKGSNNIIYDEIETEEWECPECTFNVQAGNICPYCDTKKS